MRTVVLSRVLTRLQSRIASDEARTKIKNKERLRAQIANLGFPLSHFRLCLNLRRLTGQRYLDILHADMTVEQVKVRKRLLFAEKSYDSIVVKEILDRVNVGRSTSYTHFRDKDDLPVGGIQDMLGPVPSLTGMGRMPGEIGFGVRGGAILHERLRKVLTGLVTGVMKKDVRRGRYGRGWLQATWCG